VGVLSERSKFVTFKVDLDVFAGPLDLLLYLVKKHEVDVTEVPIAKVTEEFIAYLEILEELAIDQVGEFVELASVLLEIKARALVPRPEEQEEIVEPVREDLVETLLEYKQFRDAAVLLEDRAREWEARFIRSHVEELPRKGPPEQFILPMCKYGILWEPLRVFLNARNEEDHGKLFKTIHRLKCISRVLNECLRIKEKSRSHHFLMSTCQECA